MDDEAAAAMNFVRNTSEDECPHPDDKREYFTYGAPGYGGGIYCTECGETLSSSGGILTEEDVR